MTFQFERIADSGSLLPDPDRARRYRTILDKLSLKKLTKGIEIVEKACGLDMSELKSRMMDEYVKPQDRSRVPPVVHFQCHRLLNAIKKQHPEDALVALSEIESCVLSCDGVSISSIVDERLSEAEKQMFPYVLENKDLKLLDGGILPVNYTPSKSVSAATAREISKAWRTLSQSSPDLAEELYWYICKIVYLMSDDLISGSIRTCPGLMVLGCLRGEQNFSTVIELIVHEAAHQYLFLVEARDELILNEDHRQYFSPLKGRDRPLSGVFHALVVTARVIWCLSELARKNCFEPRETSIILAKNNTGANSLSHHFRLLDETIIKHAKLSELGGRIHRSARDLVAASKDSPVWSELFEGNY